MVLENMEDLVKLLDILKEKGVLRYKSKDIAIDINPYQGYNGSPNTSLTTFKAPIEPPQPKEEDLKLMQELEEEPY